MSAAYLVGLDRAETDELIREAEHAHRKAHIALVNAPLRREAVISACGVAQDCMALQMDAYEHSMLLMAAEFDRVFDLGGDDA
jgi:hypothetical protein